jgi:hypothetical protein
MRNHLFRTYIYLIQKTGRWWYVSSSSSSGSGSGGGGGNSSITRCSSCSRIVVLVVYQHL